MCIVYIYVYAFMLYSFALYYIIINVSICIIPYCLMKSYYVLFFSWCCNIMLYILLYHIILYDLWHVIVNMYCTHTHIGLPARWWLEPGPGICRSRTWMPRPFPPKKNQMRNTSPLINISSLYKYPYIICHL